MRDGTICDALLRNLLTIGNGTSNRPTTAHKEEKAPWEHGHVEANTVHSLIDKLFSDVKRNMPTREYCSERATLAITNKDVAYMNNRIIKSMPGLCCQILAHDDLSH